MAFTFNEQDHTYWLDGKELMSASKLISPLGEDIEEGLEDIFAAAAERGTILHAALANALVGVSIEDDLPDDYLPYWEAINLFLVEHEIEPIAIEEPIYSEALRVAGTPDILCRFDGKLALLDYKFVAQVAKTKAKAQLNIYTMMYEEQGVSPESLYIVQFMKGAYRLYPVAIGREEVEACLKIRELKEKKHTRGRID